MRMTRHDIPLRRYRATTTLDAEGNEVSTWTSIDFDGDLQPDMQYKGSSVASIPMEGFGAYASIRPLYFDDIDVILGDVIYDFSDYYMVRSPVKQPWGTHKECICVPWEGSVG